MERQLCSKIDFTNAQSCYNVNSINWWSLPKLLFNKETAPAHRCAALYLIDRCTDWTLLLSHLLPFAMPLVPQVLHHGPAVIKLHRIRDVFQISDPQFERPASIQNLFYWSTDGTIRSYNIAVRWLNIYFGWSLFKCSLAFTFCSRAAWDCKDLAWLCRGFSWDSACSLPAVNRYYSSRSVQLWFCNVKYRLHKVTQDLIILNFAWQFLVNAEWGYAAVVVVT